jgi:hypothetical protein
MSTLLFARSLRTVERNPDDFRAAEAEDPKSKLSDLALRLAALVPAEVLAIYAFMLASWTEKDASGVTTVTDEPLLKAFYPGVALAPMVGVLISRFAQWKLRDIGLAIIPSLAFVTWTMVTGSSYVSLWSWWVLDKLHGDLEYVVGGLLGFLALAAASRITASP